MLLPTMDATAPELIYFDTTGHKRTLAELHGKVVLLNFWATWCGPCRLEMPMLSKLQHEHASQGFVVLYVSLDTSRRCSRHFLRPIASMASREGSIVRRRSTTLASSIH